MMQKKLFIILSILLPLISGATHIVGGDFQVKQVGRNEFELILTAFRDCDAGSSTVINPQVWVFENGTNNRLTKVDLTLLTSTDTAILGDECFAPTGICIEERKYIKRITLADNPNGYYLTYSVCCRDEDVMNIFTTGTSGGSTYYIQLPNPAVNNSTPYFGAYPKAGYFCENNCKTLDLKVVDPDNDSLVYSLITPYDQNGGTGKPISTSRWEPTYSLNSILGPGSTMSIDSRTGEILACGNIKGIYAFAVLVEEYRDGVKLGETVRDFQFEVLTCGFDSPPEYAQFSETQEIEVLSSSCFDVASLDVNQSDTLTLELSGELIEKGAEVFLPEVSNSNEYVFQYTNSTTGNRELITAKSIIEIDKHTFQSVSTVGARVCIQTDCNDLDPGSYNLDLKAISGGCSGYDTIRKSINVKIIPMKTNETLVPNVFTPNNDGKNDVLKLNGTYDPCYDQLDIKIVNRWGKEVYSSNDPNFEWDGKNANGNDVESGSYFVLLEGTYGRSLVTSQYPVNVFK